ncbi:DUF4179 domain-containing protein [uncultured Dysosmobacter sp.]|uniref:DUF4179 domain-containing protein n=1 Tax=uncultured Dysosmobacter sp. TaxID=2591384 RepID=UPI00261080AC|nr:DUF4179 domain-containing protein [uncultured Dysosmobacter sp.]
MNAWYELTSELETDTPPLDEMSRARIEKKVRAALPRRRKRRWAAAVIAAALVLSACGYAAVTGQFSQWFWNRAADVQTPEASEDLLSSMGTVIGQSQTVDGVTMTLHGALWDRGTLMLSLSMDGAEMPTYYDESSGDSWLWFSEHQMESALREAHPDLPDADLQKYMDSVRSFIGRPTITYLYNRQTDTCYLQVQNNSITSQNDQDELTLHLENLKCGNTTLKGPFEFTFIVEKKSVELVYEGDVTLEPMEGVPIRVTKVTISPFYAEVAFAGLEPLPEEDGEDSGNDFGPKLEALRINGQEAAGIASQHGSRLEKQEDGSWGGSTKTGPFHRVLNPAAVEAIRVNDVWLDLDQLDLVQ